MGPRNAQLPCIGLHTKYLCVIRLFTLCQVLVPVNIVCTSYRFWELHHLLSNGLPGAVPPRLAKPWSPFSGTRDDWMAGSVTSAIGAENWWPWVPWSYMLDWSFSISSLDQVYIYNMFLSYRWIQWDTWCTYLDLVGSLNHLLRCASSNPWTHLSYHIWLQVLSLDLCGRSMVGTKHYNVGFLHGNLILFTIEENSKLPLPHLPPHVLGWKFGPSF